MNCEPIVISNGSDDGEAFLKGLPETFVADIDGHSCNTAKSESAVLNIPNPGVFGELLNDPDPEAIGNCSPDVIVPNPRFGAGARETLLQETFPPMLQLLLARSQALPPPDDPP